MYEVTGKDNTLESEKRLLCHPGTSVASSERASPLNPFSASASFGSITPKKPKTKTLNMTETLAKIDIRINANKMDEMAPDLKGWFEFRGKHLEVALWSRRTKAGDRTYHSFRITSPYRKGETPEVYLKGGKLYELDGADVGSPDYQGPEAFTLLGQSCHAAMWIETEPDGSDSDDLAFRMELISKPFPAKLTRGAAETQSDLRERTLERRRERELREQEMARDVAALHEDLNMEPEPEAVPERPF